MAGSKADRNACLRANCYLLVLSANTHKKQICLQICGIGGTWTGGIA